MAYLRLVSSTTKKEFAISTRVIDGYLLDPKEEAITLYAQSFYLELDNTVKSRWDNWDEFVEQVKAEFKESNDDF